MSHLGISASSLFLQRFTFRLPAQRPANARWRSKDNREPLNAQPRSALAIFMQVFLFRLSLRIGVSSPHGWFHLPTRSRVTFSFYSRVPTYINQAFSQQLIFCAVPPDFYNLWVRFWLDRTSRCRAQPRLQGHLPWSCRSHFLI